MEYSEFYNLLRNTIEATSDGIYISGLNGKYVVSNHCFSDMFRIPKESVDSTDYQEILDLILDQIENPVSFLNWVTNLEKYDTIDIYPMKLLDGRRYDCYSAPLDSGDTDEGRIWTFEDVTKLKRTEETAMLYLDLMSHDIRNRLQGISMSVEILNIMIEDPDSILTITDIENNVLRCAALISKVKAAERINDAPIIPRSINDVITTSIQSIHSRFSDVVIHCDIGNQQIIMNVDRFLETLIINLLENAVLHNPDNDKQIWIRLQEQKKGIEISFGDNGPGIDSQRKNDVFNKNRRYGGVGLHVAEQIAMKYGGTLKVFDRVDEDYTEGAEFRLRIPEPIVRWG